MTHEDEKVVEELAGKNCVPTTPNPKPPHSAARYARSCARSGAGSNPCPAAASSLAVSSIRTRLKAKVVIARPNDVPS